MDDEGEREEEEEEGEQGKWSRGSRIMGGNGGGLGEREKGGGRRRGEGLGIYTLLPFGE